MKKNEKILLAVGGVAALGLLIYFGSKPTPPRLVVVQQPNSLTNTVQQGVQAANALTPIVSDLFDNIFGDSNSGSTSSNSGSSLIPPTYDNVYDYNGGSGSVMSGIESAGAIQ